MVGVAQTLLFFALGFLEPLVNTGEGGILPGKIRVGKLLSQISDIVFLRLFEGLLNLSTQSLKLKSNIFKNLAYISTPSWMGTYRAKAPPLTLGCFKGVPDVGREAPQWRQIRFG